MPRSGNFLTCELPTLLTLSATDLKKHPEFTMATKLDWRKVSRFLDGTWPTPWPKVHMLGESRDTDISWYREAIKAKYMVFDVETERLDDDTYSGKVIQVGLYPAAGTPAIWDVSVAPEFNFTALFRRCISTMPTVGHNTPFDISRIWDNFGITVWEYTDVHDTILMHHLLWPEFPHNLGFVASVYSEHPKAKHLGVGNYDYLVGDVVSTAEAYEEMLVEFAADPATASLYYDELKILFPLMVYFMHTGVPVNADFVSECLDWIPQQMAAARRIAEAYAGYPMSMDSGPQKKVLLDEVENIFEAAKKLLGFSIKRKLTEKGELSLDKDTINELRAAWVPVDHNESLDLELAEQRIAAGAHPLLESIALWNRTRILMSNYIKPLLVPLVEMGGEYYYQGSLHVGEGSPQLKFKDMGVTNEPS